MARLSDKRIPPAIFKRNCLTVGAEELEKKIGVEIFLNTLKNGRTVLGCEMPIFNNRVYNKSVFEKERQTDIYDFLGTEKSKQHLFRGAVFHGNK